MSAYLKCKPAEYAKLKILKSTRVNNTYLISLWDILYNIPADYLQKYTITYKINDKIITKETNKNIILQFRMKFDLYPIFAIL